jgi:hypothetical protein
VDQLDVVQRLSYVLASSWVLEARHRHGEVLHPYILAVRAVVQEEEEEEYHPMMLQQMGVHPKRMQVVALPMWPPEE